MNDQALISGDEASSNENAIEGVIYVLDLVPTVHEAREGENSDNKIIQSFETEIEISIQDNAKTKSRHTIKRPARWNDAEFETNTMNNYIPFILTRS